MALHIKAIRQLNQTFDLGRKAPSWEAAACFFLVFLCLVSNPGRLLTAVVPGQTTAVTPVASKPKVQTEHKTCFSCNLLIISRIAEISDPTSKHSLGSIYRYETKLDVSTKASWNETS